jgi:hypothetical protein
MQPIVDETFRRGRFVTQFVAAACFLSLITACGTESSTAPRTLQPHSADEQKLTEFGTVFDAYEFSLYTLDDAGANDDPAQSDLNKFARADNVNGMIGVAWTWDDINSWTGGGQTGDACALFDIDIAGQPNLGSKELGSVDFAVCVRINNPGGDPLVTSQLPLGQSPLLYSCGDAKTDRCTSTAALLSPAPTASQLRCEVIKTGETFTGTPTGDDGQDVLAACAIDKALFGNPTSVKLLNVCSYPSGAPNSNPFDCVVTPGSGFLQIEKMTQPAGSNVNFGFTLSPAAEDEQTSYTLNPMVNSGKTALIPVKPSPQNYSITESTIPSGWSLSNVSCAGATWSTGQTAVTGINVGVGETKICTFTNTQIGSITIIKVATPNDLQDFTFSGNLPGACASFTLDDDANVAGGNDTKLNQITCPIAAGSYNLSETVPTGWVQTSATCSDGSAINSIQVTAGESLTCTFVNTKQAKLRIVKATNPDGNTTDFEFTPTNWNGASTFTRRDNEGAFASAFLSPGSTEYTAVETVPSGWALTNRECLLTGTSTAKTFTSPSNGITVQLAAGEDVTCTFTNTKDGTLTIVKKLSPTNDPGKFDLIIAGTTYQGAGNAGFGHDGTTGAIAVTFGTVAFSESAHAGTNASDYSTALECRNGSNQVVASNPTSGNTVGSVTVGAGDQITCTFTNTRTQGSIELKKAWSGTPGETTLRIGTAPNGSDIASQATSAGLTTGAKTVNTGTFYVSETGGLADYNSALACTDNGGAPFAPVSNALTIDNGHAVVCTFTNTRKQGTIELKKVWSGTAGVTTLRIGTTANASDIASQLTSAGLTTGAKTVNTGTYYVSETGGLDDYNASLACTENGGAPFTPASNALAVDDGEVVVCTFTNTRKQGTIKVDKAWVGPGGQTTLKIGTTAGGSEVKSQQTGSAGAEPLSTGAQAVNTGTYYVSESGGLTEYTPALSCTNGASPVTPGASNSVTVAEGSSIVCTFTNTRKPKLSIAKTPNRDGTGYSVVPGATATFTITVSNAADGGPAENVIIEDVLPAGVGDWTDNQALCTVTALVGETEIRNLYCNVGTLGTNASFTVVVTATIPGNFLVKPPTANSPGLEIDGNLSKEGTDSQDWATLGIDCTSATKVGCAIDQATGSGDNSFGNGTKEDTPVPSIVSGQIPNNKSDLIRFYVASQRIVSTDHLYLAWERVQEPSGSTNMDFELNQSNQVSSNLVTPVRTVGDVLITYDLAQGGATAVLGYHRWVDAGSCGGNGAKPPCWGVRTELTTDETQDFAGTINSSVVTDPIAPDAGRSLSVRTFGEARIDLPASGIFIDGLCTVFGKAYLKSRSSDSFSAAVKDFIAPIQINVSNCEAKELKNEARARSSNYAPPSGTLNDWFADSGWIRVSDGSTSSSFLIPSTVREVADSESTRGLRRPKAFFERNDD